MGYRNEHVCMDNPYECTVLLPPKHAYGDILVLSTNHIGLHEILYIRLLQIFFCVSQKCYPGFIVS